jgi:Tfp pilus assembly protein PilV
MVTLLVLGVGGYMLYQYYQAHPSTQTQVVNPQGQQTGTLQPNQTPAVGSQTNAPPGTTFYQANGTSTTVDNNGNVIPTP